MELWDKDIQGNLRNVWENGNQLTGLLNTNNFLKTPRADVNHDSHVRKRKGGESASATNPKKVCIGNHKTKKMKSIWARIQPV